LVIFCLFRPPHPSYCVCFGRAAGALGMLTICFGTRHTQEQAKKEGEGWMEYTDEKKIPADEKKRVKTEQGGRIEKEKRGPISERKTRG